MQFAVRQRYGVCGNRLSDVCIVGFKDLAGDDLVNCVTGCFGELLEAVLSKLITH